MLKLTLMAYQKLEIIKVTVAKDRTEKIINVKFLADKDVEKIIESEEKEYKVLRSWRRIL